MATFVNYSSLVQDVQNYLERGGSVVTDTTVFNQIPRLINAAERKCAQFLKLLGQIEFMVDPAGLQTGLPIIPKPDRWRKTVSLNFGTGTNLNVSTPLNERSYEYCRAYWPDNSLTDQPLFYAEMDQGHWYIAPTPIQNYPLQVVAYMQPMLLDSTNQNNFWTQYTPNLLLYTTLLETEPFLKDDGRIAVWKDFFATELQTLTEQDLQRVMDRFAERKTV